MDLQPSPPRANAVPSPKTISPASDDSDDKEATLETMKEFATATVADDETSPTQRSPSKPPPLAGAQIKDLPSDSNNLAVWFLMDSGSSVKAVHFEKILPGAHKTNVPKEKRNAYSTANGQPLANEGCTVIRALTDKNHEQVHELRDVNVEFPILSTGYLTKSHIRKSTRSVTMRLEQTSKASNTTTQQTCSSGTGIFMCSACGSRRTFVSHQRLPGRADAHEWLLQILHVNVAFRTHTTACELTQI